MGSRPQTSGNPNHPYDKYDDNNDTTGAAVAVAAVAGVAALAAWGISKWFGNSESEPKRQDKMLLSSTSSSLAPARDYVYPTPTINKNFEGKSRYNNPVISGLSSEDKWTKPRPGWVKLNTDGSVSPERWESASGGLIRDATGQWIVGFTARLEYCDITSAELQGLREGLRLAWRQGYKRVEIETDCEPAFILIEKPDLKLDVHRYGRIVEDIRNLRKLKWETTIVCIGNERNKCADVLAKRCRRFQSEELMIWHEVPEYVRDLVSNEMMS